jgi:rubrerythrin
MRSGRSVLNALLSDEHEAIASYGKASPQFRKGGKPGIARLLTHIQGEEKEHARELSERLADGIMGEREEKPVARARRKSVTSTARKK